MFLIYCFFFFSSLYPVVKQFLKGMADLDKPDLDLVSVLTEYKGRALTALIDRLNDSDLPLSPGGPTTSFLSTSRSNQHNEQLLLPASISLPNLTDESMHDNIQENEIEKDFPSSGHLLPTPQLQLKKNYNTTSNYSRSSSNLLSYKSRQILGDSRQSILKKLPPLSPVHRVWGNDEGYSSSSLEKSKSVSYLKSLQANSLESKAVQAAARDCQAGYFTAARFCKNPPWKSISCGIFPKLPEISPIRQRRNTLCSKQIGDESLSPLYYLNSDPSIQCVWYHYCVATLFGLLYSLGIPLFLVGFLYWGKNKELLFDEEHWIPENFYLYA